MDETVEEGGGGEGGGGGTGGELPRLGTRDKEKKRGVIVTPGGRHYLS